MTDDFSAAEETESKMSEAAGGVESWADSDDQSEIDNKKKVSINIICNNIKYIIYNMNYYL